MPPAKRTSSNPKTSSAKPASGQRATRAAASSGAKATATSARKAAGRTSTQAKSGAAKTGRTASTGAGRTARVAREGAAATARAAGDAAGTTARSARSGARGTAKAAGSGGRATATRAKAAATQTKNASGEDSLVAAAEQLVRGTASSGDVVTLTREWIQDALDEAASRGRMTRKDANELVAELMRLGRQQGDDVVGEVSGLLGRGRGSVESATKRARSSGPVDRIVRGADRARRAAGVGPSFPIIGYDELKVGQVQARIKELSKPDQRKVLNYERKHANRKSVVGPLEKSLG